MAGCHLTYYNITKERERERELSVYVKASGYIARIYVDIPEYLCRLLRRLYRMVNFSYFITN